MDEGTTSANGNGHNAAEEDLRSLQELRQLESDILLTRAQFARQVGIAFGGKRDYYEVFGYDRDLTARQFRETYARGGIAKRIVEAYPKATWRRRTGGFGVEIYEDEDPETETAFEAAFADLNKRVKIWKYLERADVLAGLSTYSVLLIGAPGDLESELPKARKPEDLLYLSPYWGGGGPQSSMQASTTAADVDATIWSYDEDPQSPRFGEPLFYQLKRTNLNLPGQMTRVHWTRCIHVAEGCLDDNVFGIPTLENVWNLLQDLLKTTGGGSEAFWLRANQGFHADIDKDMKLDADKTLDKLREDMERYQHNMTRWIRTRGVSVDVLGSDVANFGPPADAILKQIAGSKGIPLRILTGSEQGQLASGQDAENWNSQVQDRCMSHAEPNIVRPLIDRLIEYGYLPEPQEPYQVAWPVEEEMTEPQKADLGVKLAQTNATNGDLVFTDAEIREKTFGMKPLTDEQRKEVADRKAEEAKQALKQQQEMMKAQQPPAPKEPAPAIQARAASASELEPLIDTLASAIEHRDFATVYEIVRAAGSASSGNYGHEGRPGQVGGSSSGGFDPESPSLQSFRNIGIATPQQREKLNRAYIAIDRMLHDPDIGAELWSRLSQMTPAGLRQELADIAAGNQSDQILGGKGGSVHTTRAEKEIYVQPPSSKNQLQLPAPRAAAKNVDDVLQEIAKLATDPVVGPSVLAMLQAALQYGSWKEFVKSLRHLGDVEGHPFHGNQYTSGAGGGTSDEGSTGRSSGPTLSGDADAVRAAHQLMVDLPVGVRKDMQGTTMHVFNSENEAATHINDYLQEHYGMTLEKTAKALVDRGRNEVITTTDATLLHTQVARSMTERIQSPEWDKAARSVGLSHEDAMIQSILEIAKVTGNPVALGLHMSHEMIHTLKKWKWFK